MIIGLLGSKNCGKSTVANYLHDFYGFEKLSYAEPIKDVCSIIFGWNRELLEGVTPESRIWRETVDEYWAQKLNIPDFCPRKAFTLVGSDLFRECIHADIWINCLINKIKPYTNYVITDCRHIKETQVLIDMDGMIIRITRDGFPKWESIAKKAVLGDLSAINKMLDLKIHRSEYEWVCCDYDHNIDNYGSIEELYVQVRNIIRGHGFNVNL